MISESYYWKRELLRVAAALRKRLSQRRWPEASFAAIEMNVMMGFYSIRKLADAKKLSDEIVVREFSLIAYPAVGEPVHRGNAHKFDGLYDLNSPRSISRSLAFVWNQVIHSYIFASVLGENRGLERILFCSDKERNKLLYEIRLGEVIGLFETIGKNVPASIHSVFNPKINEWDVSVGPHLKRVRDAQL